jgi:hypothetical protein
MHERSQEGAHVKQAANSDPHIAAGTRRRTLIDLRTTHLLTTGLAGLAAVLVVAGATGCSSSKKQAATTSTSAAGTSGAPGAGASADAAAIKDAYVKLFAISTPLNTSVSLLQDGVDFRGTLEAQSKTALAKQASVTVSAVKVTSANRATVTFTVLLNNSPVLPNQSGYAVREGGHWKVAGATFCGLLTAQGNPPAACKKAVATSLPS